MSKDCWDAQPDGKGGKEKQGKGGKSQAKAEKAAAGGGGGASTPRSANKSGTKCWNCGEKGHVAVDCKKPKQEGKGKGKQKKGKQRSLTEEEGQSEAEPECETIMALNSSEISVVAERTGARIAGVCSVKGQTEAWLVDSGATSHVMTREALRRYEVVRVHHSVPELWSAAEERIRTYGLVDLRVQFGKSRFVVTDVIVAEVSFCVLSSFALAQHDWVMHLSRKVARCKVNILFWRATHVSSSVNSAGRRRGDENEMGTPNHNSPTTSPERIGQTQRNSEVNSGHRKHSRPSHARIATCLCTARRVGTPKFPVSADSSIVTIVDRHRIRSWLLQES